MLLQPAQRLTWTCQRRSCAASMVTYRMFNWAPALRFICSINITPCRSQPGIVRPTFPVASAFMKYTYRAVAALAAGLACLASPLQAHELDFQGSPKGRFYACGQT